MTHQHHDGRNAVVIYHQHCPDGFGAAWAMSKQLPHAKFHPMQHGDPTPDFAEVERVYIVDFSLPRDVMEQLQHSLGADHVTLLDHHQTAAQELVGLPNCHIDLEHSGAVLAWQYCFPDQRVPPLLQYVEDRDLWKWELPHSRAVNAYIGSYQDQPTFELWDEINHEIFRVETFVEVVARGEAILRHTDALVNAACQSAQIATIGKHRAPAVYSATLRSEIGARLLEMHPEAPFAVIHHDDGYRHRYSLRSRPDGPDVAAICHRLGGGGHPQAAGFHTDSDRWPILINIAE